MSRARDPRRARTPGAAPLEQTPTRTELRRELRVIARAFVERLVEALEQHGVFEEPKRDDDDDQSRRVRRSADVLGEMGERVLAHLRTRKRPVAISEIAVALETSTRALAHPLALLVASGRVERSGARRGARYRLAGKSMAPPSRRTAPPPSVRVPTLPPPKGGRRRAR